MPSKNRPKRLQIVNELGSSQTLPDGPGFFTALGRPAGRVLVLGLGPNPAVAAALLEGEGVAGTGVSYVECEKFSSLMPEAWRAAIPAAWTRLSPADVQDGKASFDAAILYAPNIKLFPSFWGPLLAAAQLALLGPRPPAGPERAVIMPGTERGLLARELADAFAACGRTVLSPDPANLLERLPDILRQGRPELFFSVNFAGLDAYGRTFHLLRAAGVRTAVWCVDNPFHLLSGLKSPFWRELDLFVTDDWFLEPLRREGAGRAAHLPLAACESFFNPGQAKEADGLSGRAVFVGRSRFPGKDGFFAGCKTPPELWEKALALLGRGGRPDFGWWADKLGSSPFWPGKAVREAGFGAEESGLALRTACLRAAGELGLTVFGDAGWRDALPQGADLRPEVDYYGPLASIYAEAGYCLNVTSLLLPRGLTQRHFDVFAAGGFLLSDATPGLDLFPQELTRPMTFAAPAEIPALAARLESERGLRGDLIRAWRAHIYGRHRYEHRVASVLEALEGAY